MSVSAARLRSAALTLLLLGMTASVACRSPAPSASDDATEAEAKRGTPPVLSTPQADEKVGKEASEEVGTQIGLVKDLALTAYVEAIGRRLVRNAPGYRFDYSFRISDQAEPNAFALPGGFIYVSRGALALSNDEAELANVLGHEIAHVASRHAAASQQVAIGGSFARAFQAPFLAAYGRSLENSADRIGQGLAAVSGYDPHGLTEFLESLDQLERLRTGISRNPGFFDTHPTTRGRTSETAQRAEGIAWQPEAGFSKNRAEHLRRLDGLVLGPSADQGVFVGQRFLHPELGFSLRFPDGWRTLNTPRAVGAVSPDRQAQVFLEHSGESESAAAAAQEWLEENQDKGVRLEVSQQIRLGGRVAHRLTANASQGGAGVSLLITFIPHAKQIYRLTGVTQTPRSHEPVFVSVARSFRPMTRELLAQVTETRLRIAEAREGESLGELSRRTNNSWPVLETAIMNGLRSDGRLQAGDLVKIAVEQPYLPSSLKEEG